MSKKQESSAICTNRRARFDFALEDTAEAGVILTGSEVKSIRAGNVQINEAYANFLGDELWLINAHIAPYDNAGYVQHDPRRSRKLLMHRKELDRLRHARESKGYTVVPVKLYWKKGNVKLQIALAKGKKQVDKRETIKQREWNRQKHRILKG
ncbi:MAG: SsrA-binding protein SmpB [Alphaproteobacteria bacterium]|nr:SsrA-binding protein SmpB [Alphaproteobacteria bacterium]